MIKPIIDFDGYFISTEGKVYCNLGKGRRDRSKRVDLYEIHPRPNKNGYVRVSMRQISTGKIVDKYVHRLVAEYFIEKPEGKNVVNHKDCNRSNNNVDNLEWVSVKENVEYAFRVGNLTRDVATGRMMAKN